MMFPKTGHVVNLEEPELFNQVVGDFLARVDAGRWPARDPRSLAQAAVGAVNRKSGSPVQCWQNRGGSRRCLNGQLSFC